MNIIIKPVITEKMTAHTDKFGRYGFYVSRTANKIDVKNAIEKMYSVTVTEVRTMNTPGKVKRRMTRSGVLAGRVGKYKKAVVALKKGEVIDFYSNI